MIIRHEREKLFNAIVYFVKNTKYCGKTKLFKLLYFLDFTAFKEFGINVTGLDYYTWPKGPAPISLHNEFKHPSEEFGKRFSVIKYEESDRLNIRPKEGIKFDPGYFSKGELQILEQLAYIYKDAQATDMVEITHLRNSPWDKTVNTKGKNKIIDYILAFDADNKSLSLEQYKEIKETREIMDSLLSKCKKAK